MVVVAALEVGAGWACAPPGFDSPSTFADLAESPEISFEG
jgi:hypothetical protein